MNIKDFFVTKYQNNRELSSSFGWRLTQILTKQGSSALMFFIATYFLTKGEMGIYNYMSSALFLMIVFADFGISTATSKYVAQYNSISKEKVGRVLFNSGIIIFLASILVILFLTIFSQKIFPEYYRYLYYAFPFIFIYPLTSLLDGIYRGLKRFKVLAIVSICTGILGVLSSYFLVTAYGLVGAILTQVVFFSIYAFILLLLHRGYEFKYDSKIVKDIISYSIYFGIATLGYFLFSKVNILILGSYNLLEEIAVYELLNKIFAIYLIPFTVLGQVLAPNVVEMFSLKKYENVRRLFKRSLIYFFGLAILFIPVGMFVTKIGISMLFPEYSSDILMVLLLPVALTSAKALPVLVINTGLITSTGHAKYMAIENVIVGVLNVLINIFVIQIYGYVGVVWVTLILQSISLVVLYTVYYRKLKSYS
jgi:O-antigen/teichoic acid export membrane protein